MDLTNVKDIFSEQYQNFNHPTNEEYLKEIIYQLSQITISYEFYNYTEIINFLMKNYALIELISQLKGIIREWFEEETLILEYDVDPEIRRGQIVIYIKLKNNDFKSALKKLHCIDKELNKLKTEETRGKILISVE